MCFQIVLFFQFSVSRYKSSSSFSLRYKSVIITMEGDLHLYGEVKNMLLDFDIWIIWWYRSSTVMMVEDKYKDFEINMLKDKAQNVAIYKNSSNSEKLR